MVTVAAVEGYSGIMGIGYSRPEYLDLIAAWLRGHDRPYRRSIILLVAQDTAQMLAREGWTREAMRQYIRERARIPFGEWNRQYHGAKEARKGVPEEVFSIAEMQSLFDLADVNAKASRLDSSPGPGSAPRGASNSTMLTAM